MDDVEAGVVILLTLSLDAELAVLVFLNNLEEAVDVAGFRNTSLGPFEGGFNNPPFTPPEVGGVGAGVPVGYHHPARAVDRSHRRKAQRFESAAPQIGIDPDRVELRCGNLRGRAVIAAACGKQAERAKRCGEADGLRNGGKSACHWSDGSLVYSGDALYPPHPSRQGHCGAELGQSASL